MAGPKEHWDLLNIPVTFPCYRRTFDAARALAFAKGIAIMIRHHGPRPDVNDRTRVNHYVQPSGERTYKTDGHGWAVDVDT